MTSFLTGGLGSLNSNPTSRESRALDASKTAGKSFVNKDFVKNIAFLNQTADTHGAWLQKLQSGVDQANQNVLEQVQGFWGDMFVLFAGLEPTGIDVGDVKYVIQGLGAFLGISPDTPFPLNLFEAALHFLETYIIPLDQFTDVIFDAILAWAEELGLSEEFINSIKELMEAVTMLGESFMDLFDSLGELLSAFGFLDWTSTSGLGELWDTLVNLIDGLALEPLKPVLELLADLGIPFIEALTAIVNGANSILVPITSIIRGSPNILVAGQFTDSDSFVAQNGWTRDAFVGRTFEGSAKTTGNGTVRELISDPIIAVEEGQKVEQEVYISWASASYTGTNHAQLTIRAYNSGTLVNQTVLQSITFGVTTQATWQKLSGSVTIGAGITHVRMSLKVNANVLTGNIWFDDASLKRQGGYLGDLFGGLTDLFGLGFLDDFIGVNPITTWTNIITGTLNPLELLEDFGIRDLVQNLIDALISVVRGIPFIGGTLAHWITDLTDWFDDTQATAAQASDAKLGLDATREIAVVTITGAPLDEAQVVDDPLVEGAFAGQTDVIAYLTKKVATLEAQLTASPSIDDPIEYSGSPNSSMWDISYDNANGEVLANGHEFYWDNQNATVNRAVARYIGTDAVAPNDRFSSKIVIGTEAIQNTSTSNKSYIDSIIRMNSTKTRYVRGRLGRSDIRVSCFVDGTETVFDTITLSTPPGVGSEFYIIPKLGNDRIIEVHLNTAVWEVEDTGLVHFFGASYRYRGWGMRAGLSTFGFSFLQASVGTIGHWYSEAP